MKKCSSSGNRSNKTTRTRKFKKYKLIVRLARGGMAEIILASISGHPNFRKLIVIKRISPRLASDKTFVGKFLDEARVAVQLNHPNVVQTHELDVIDK